MVKNIMIFALAAESVDTWGASEEPVTTAEGKNLIGWVYFQGFETKVRQWDDVSTIYLPFD